MNDVARARLHSQRLVGERCASAVDVVEHLVAVQSQDLGGARWAVGQRIPDGTRDVDVIAAYDAGEIVRVHAMRPTWHFLAARDLRFIQALTGAKLRTGDARRQRELDLDAKKIKRGIDSIAKALAGKTFLTRVELADRIGLRGSVIAHVMMIAESLALVCSGPMKGKQTTYALVDERVPDTPSHGAHRARDEALHELARRYFQSHGPATARDFAWWSGLAAADARTALEGLAHEMRGKVAWYGVDVSSPSARARKTVHLLPNYDELLVAYKDRALTFSPEVLAVAKGDALFVNAIVVDGVAVGAWRKASSTAKRIALDLVVLGDAAASREVERAIDAAVARYAKFLGVDVTATRRSEAAFPRRTALPPS